jgi:hypothetical protein
LEEREMLRLTGLPAVATHPHALVERADERILIVFAGEGGTRQIDVDPRLVDESEDPESTELQLLARLQQIGYEVQWRRAAAEEPAPADADGGGSGPADADSGDPGPRGEPRGH